MAFYRGDLFPAADLYRLLMMMMMMSIGQPFCRLQLGPNSLEPASGWQIGMQTYGITILKGSESSASMFIPSLLENGTRPLELQFPSNCGQNIVMNIASVSLN